MHHTLVYQFHAQCHNYLQLSDSKSFVFNIPIFISSSTLLGASPTQMHIYGNMSHQKLQYLVPHIFTCTCSYTAYTGILYSLIITCVSVHNKVLVSYPCLFITRLSAVPEAVNHLNHRSSDNIIIHNQAFTDRPAMEVK